MSEDPTWMEEWWPTLFFGPVAIFSVIYLFLLQANGQHDVNVALCRSDLQAVHALEIKDFLRTADWAPDLDTLLGRNSFPGAVMAEQISLELLPEENFVVRVECTIDGERYLLEKERFDNRVRRR
ncbi:MAG: hypothetical protein ACI9VR_003442 [Cognaticolwellia sp.]|jgi:hypothetical protein